MSVFRRDLNPVCQVDASLKQRRPLRSFADGTKMENRHKAYIKKKSSIKCIFKDVPAVPHCVPDGIGKEELYLFFISLSALFQKGGSSGSRVPPLRAQNKMGEGPSFDPTFC